ncbi:MAG TPA: choice-of-anchor D domain-containing protein [Blastocatellia bacterium]|nr:choice-of-anchor D domain-containing protein [Blastocatellia bacterium]
MLHKRFFTIPLHVFLILTIASLEVRAQVRVVNMIPNDMSDETRHNSEPYVAVNPANPLIIAASVFMATPPGSPNGPMLVSFDGGATWVARNIIPSSPGAFFNTGDITLRFNSSGTALYAGILRAGPPGGLQIITTTDMMFNTPMTVLNTPRPTDQPYISARTVVGGPDSGRDRLWVGNNEAAANPASATVDQTLDAAIATPVFTQIRIDAGTPVGRDNYQVRPVSSADGHIYTAFYRRRGNIAGGYNADVVVVRDNNWGSTMPPFQSLVDSVTMVSGQNVVASTPVSDTAGSSAALGNDWWGGDLYLTVDPGDSSRVYISYSDSLPGSARTIHLRRSTNSGQTWSPDLLTVHSAKNAAIAINNDGKIGYLYQQLTGTSPNTRWQTHLRRSTTGATWDDVTLADFPADGPSAPTGMRIIGDYLNMVAVGKDFFGVFTSYNDLVNANFPAGVTWLRNKTPDGAASPHFIGTDGVSTVAPSIDPFFFHVAESGHIQVPSGVAFGSVCAGAIGRATLNVCNTGSGNLTMTATSSSNPQFAVTTPSGGFPIVISPGSCFPFEVTFTPSGIGAQTATLTISSDDLFVPSVAVQATAEAAAGSLGLSSNQRFVPTVIQSVGPCQSSRPFVVSNTGTCNLTITNIVIGGANAGDYSLSGLPAFPITLQPGHQVGSGDLNVVFAPAALARERIAEIAVTFVSDPASGATSVQARQLCGEGVRTGARVLVTQGGVPVPQAHEISLRRYWGGWFGFSKKVDEVENVALQTAPATPGTACGPIQFHREYGATSNPTQLVPGVYKLKVEVKIAGKEVSKTVWFNVDTCGFNGTIVVDF